MCMACAPKAFISELSLTQRHRNVMSWHMFPIIPGSLPPGGFRGVSSHVWVQGFSSTAFGIGCFLWCCSESVQVADDSSPASV